MRSENVLGPHPYVPHEVWMSHQHFSVIYRGIYISLQLCKMTDARASTSRVLCNASPILENVTWIAV
jgi:hypothetical protein